MEDVTDDNVIAETQPESDQARQYFVAKISDEKGNFALPDNGSEPTAQQEAPPTSSGPPSIMSFLLFPEHVHPAPQDRGDQPYVDYSRSIILTTEEYLNMMADKSAKKTAVAKVREKRHVEAESSKRRHKAEKSQAEAEKSEKREAKKAFNALWTPTACTIVRQRLYNLIKHAVSRQESILQLQLRVLSTPICRQNMKLQWNVNVGRRLDSPPMTYLP